MERQKLHAGISKLLLAEIIMLFATLGGSILAVVLQKNETALGFVGLGFMAALIAAAVIQFIGLAGIRKFNSQLNEAFWLVIGMIIVSFICGLLPVIFPSKFNSNMVPIATTVIMICFAFSLVDGIRQAVPEVNDFGKKALIIYGIAAIADSVIKVLDVFDKGSGVAATIIATIGLICEAVFSIVFIIFLAKAKKASAVEAE